MRAIVLGGGGTKGSYEIGAWKALKELGISYDIVTGTSIGALNGAFMVQEDLKVAEHLWNTIKLGDIINWPDKNKEFILKKGNLGSMMKNYIYYRGLDIEPLKKMIEERVDFNKIKHSRYLFGVTAVELPFMNPIEQNIKDTKEEVIRDYLLASASCYPVFPACKIDQHYYIDGGYYDNLPIDFAFDLGATEVIAIDLNYKITHPRYLHHEKVHYIKPSRDLGPFLFFHKETIDNNKKLGYLDTMKSFNQYIGIEYAFKKNNHLQKEQMKFLESLTWMEEHYRTSLIVEEIKENAILTFIKGLEATMNFFLEDPYQLYEMEEVIQKYRLEIPDYEEERSAFDMIASIEECFDLVKQKGKWYLLKLLNYYLFEKKWKVPFLTEIFLYFKKEILILLFLKSL